ncbi:hypothetical protein BaRGS_00017368, partial [Batillaria attramentaria]
MTVRKLSTFVLLIVAGVGCFTTAQGRKCNGASTTVNAGAGPGTIYSPGYPDDYSNSDSCSWRVTARAGEVVQLEVLDMDVARENSTDCGDFLVAYDGPSASSTELRKWCGTYLIQFRSTGQDLFLHFQTDAMSTRKGFAINYYSVAAYDTECTGVVTHRLTVGTTPLFLDISAAGLPRSKIQCTWTFETTGSQLLRVETVTTSGYLDCEDGYLSVSEEKDSASGNTVKWCDSFVAPFSFYYSAESGGKVVIVLNMEAKTFSRDSDLRNLRFKVETRSNVETCTPSQTPVLEFEKAPLYFSVPYATNSAGGGSCPVQVTQLNPEHNRGGLRVDIMTVNRDTVLFDCKANTDAVMFYEGTAVDEDKRAAGECWGRYVGPVFRTMYGTATFVAVQGKTVFLRVVPLEEDTYRQMATTLTFPTGPIPSMLAPYSLCHILFEADESDYPLVKFDIDFKRGQGCAPGGDYILAYNGNTTDEPAIFRYCYRQKETRFVIGQTNRMLVQFITDGDHNFGEVTMTYYSVAGRTQDKLPCPVDPETGSPRTRELEATAEWQALTSVNYPGYYPPYVCDDRLVFYDEYPIGDNVIGHVCGGDLDVKPIESSAQSMLVVFTSDNQRNMGGWKLEYRSAEPSTSAALSTGFPVTVCARAVCFHDGMIDPDDAFCNQ